MKRNENFTCCCSVMDVKDILFTPNLKIWYHLKYDCHTLHENGSNVGKSQSVIWIKSIWILIQERLRECPTLLPSRVFIFVSRPLEMPSTPAGISHSKPAAEGQPHAPCAVIRCDFWRKVNSRQQEEGKFVLFGRRYIIASKRKVISYFLAEGMMEEGT